MERVERAVVRPLEHEVAGRREVAARADVGEGGEHLLPRLLAARRLVGGQRRGRGERGNPADLLEVAAVAEPVRPRPETVAERLDDHRDGGVLAGDVEQAGPRAERGRAEARAAVGDDEVLVDGVGRVDLPRLRLQLGVVEVHERGAERGHRNAPRIVGNRLRRVDHLARHVGLGGHRRLHHRVDGHPGLAVPEVEQAVLAGGADAPDGLAVAGHVEEHRPRDVVPVPEVVVDGLVVPAQRPRLEVEGDGGVGEQVGPGAGRAVVVGRRVAGVEVDEAELEVDGGLGPHPAAGHLAVAPGLACDVPPVVLGALGNGVEHPPDGAGLGVGGDDEAAGDVVLRVRRAQVERPVVVGGGARDAVADVVRIQVRRIGVRVLGLQRQGDDREHPAVAVRLDELAGAGVDRHQVGPGVGVDLPLGPGRPARPGLPGRVELERPHRLAGRRADGHHVGAGVEVHQAVDDERRHLTDVDPGRHRDRPQLRQLPDVPGVDLVEGRVAAVREVEVVAGPVGLTARGDVGRGGPARRRALRRDPARARRDDGKHHDGRHQPLRAVP